MCLRSYVRLVDTALLGSTPLTVLSDHWSSADRELLIPMGSSPLTGLRTEGIHTGSTSYFRDYSRQHATEYGDGARYSEYSIAVSEWARSARRNFRVSLRRTTDFRPPVTPCQQIFALRYENLFCPDSVRLQAVTSLAAPPTARVFATGSACFASCFPTEQPPRAHKAVPRIVELSGWNQPST